MEFLITEFGNYLDEIILFVTALFGVIVVAIRTLISRIGFALLAGIGRGAGTGLGGKLTGGGGAGGQLDSRRMPASPRTRKAKQALWQASAREKRMDTYLSAWADLLAETGGPYALSIHLLGFLQPGFRGKVERLQQRCKEFDRLEDKAQRVLQRYEADHDRKCAPLRDDILQDELDLTRWKARHRRWQYRLWRKRWRYNKKSMLAIRRRIFDKRIALFRREYALNIGYRAVLEPVLKAVDDYERTYLSHWVHSFEADLKSFRLTVMSGRLIDMIYQEADDAFKTRFGLNDLPADAAKLPAFLKAALEEAGTGVAPDETCESLFETYLRVRLLKDHALCARWGLNPAWIERHLPPPGALGIAQERYEHLPSNTGWLPDTLKQARPIPPSQSAA